MKWHHLHTGKTLQQRLAELQGHLAELNTPRSGLEPGRIKRVYSRHFIKVNRQLFIPLSLLSIRVFDTPQTRRGVRVGIRTVFPSKNAFRNIRLVGVGLDYLELQGTGKFPSRILFPLSQIESIHRPTIKKKKQTR
ncbi:hypothetical protein [Paenibacillus illinoisensis]|jgi:hypothetical protein|uniref:Uncharacterized protein n=1 Tax=Paenibacillus illinoisensis TaxID=59845 RepID=A0A2W0C398_9BACL|nr:hypothetical protein [Paenibacillus illinoisensis]MBM6385875.1 hypothetical protein [Paenibacillus sp.]PYY26590.1 Uncharacterized protein PIL02S_06000 [Paenibacillus illinoisensis]